MYRRCHVKCALLLPDHNQSCNFSRNVQRIFKYQISRISVHWQPRCSMRIYGRTDGQTDMPMPIVAFRNFRIPLKWVLSKLLLAKSFNKPAGLIFFFVPLLHYAKYTYNNVAAFSNFKFDEGFTHQSAWHTLLYVNVFSGNTTSVEFAD